MGDNFKQLFDGVSWRRSRRGRNVCDQGATGAAGPTPATHIGQQRQRWGITGDATFAGLADLSYTDSYQDYHPTRNGAMTSVDTHVHRT